MSGSNFTFMSPQTSEFIFEGILNLIGKEKVFLKCQSIYFRRKSNKKVCKYDRQNYPSYIHLARYIIKDACFHETPNCITFCVEYELHLKQIQIANYQYSISCQNKLMRKNSFRGITLKKLFSFL